MPNIPKPDLERGNYLVYTDEPDTVYDNAGGGGGGAAFDLDYDSSQLDPYIPTFTYNQVKNAIERGNFPFTRCVYSSEGYTHIEVYPIMSAIDNGDDSYTVATDDATYVATGPDIVMSIGLI